MKKNEEGAPEGAPVVVVSTGVGAGKTRALSWALAPPGAGRRAASAHALSTAEARVAEARAATLAAAEAQRAALAAEDAAATARQGALIALCDLMRYPEHVRASARIARVLRAPNQKG